MAKNWNTLSTNLELLLDEVKFQRRKDARRLFKEDNGFVVLHGTTHWTDLFVRHFLFETDRSIDSDDLLFFIRKRHVKGTTRYLPKFETEVEVFRRDSKKLPIGDPDIAWEETVYLNLIIHQFDYTLTLAICTRTSPKDLQVLKRHSQPVYASPSRRRMDVKGDVEEFTYPNICFMVDNFDEVFEDMHVRDGEMVCVELVASDRQGTVQGVLFLGSIRYEALKKVYDTRASLSSKMAQRMTFGWYGGASSQRMEFVRMKGPQGKGHAEMAVTKPKGSGLDTPSSEPGLSVTELWDSDWESEPEDFYSTTRQRRLSDPSGNSNGYRGNWRVKPDSSQSRSENEGLDRYSNGVSEIEAGDLRDGLPSVAEVPEAGPETLDKPSEGGVADDNNKPPSFSPPLIPPYTQMRKSRSFDSSSPMTSTSFVPGGSRIPLSPPSSTSPTPPFCQVLSNGTRVHYYCNIVQAQANLPTRRELDDGVCNPLWTMRGFTQTFHFWKENRRAQSVPLNALLTYVTLPWYTIISDILDRRESPILTF